MIQAITKEFFKKKVGHPNFKIIDKSLSESTIEKGVDLTTGYMPLYFFIPEFGYFVNLYGISKVAIPETNPKEINIDEQILNGNIDWSHWELRKMELARYSENEFNRLNVPGIDVSCLKGWEDNEDGKITSWMLSNTVTGEEIRFSVKFVHSDWNGDRLLVAFDELLQIPCNVKACEGRTGFINNLLTQHWNDIVWIK